MRLPIVILSFALGSLLAQPSQPPADARVWLNRGVQAFKNAQYAEAQAAFQKAVELDPNNTVPRLYLATSYMQQYIPGADSAENLAVAQKAEDTFRGVLTLNPNEKLALTSLGSLNLNQKKFDDARVWYQRLLSVDPDNAEAYYTMGFLAWSQWYPAYSQARFQAGMQPADRGPIADVAVRTNLRAQYWSRLDEGMWNLNKALELNPRYDDAMAYMNLFIRERADLRDTREEYAHDITEADQWVQKALETKRMKAQAGQMGAAGMTAPPPPPPPPSVHGGGGGDRLPVPQRIRISGDVQQNKLISQAAPVYPPLARQARVQGTVQLNVTIGRDGSVSNISVISGHPLLITAALDAVRQWRYQPTLLNGNPVEVATTAEVIFTLDK